MLFKPKYKVVKYKQSTEVINKKEGTVENYIKYKDGKWRNSKTGLTPSRKTRRLLNK